MLVLTLAAARAEPLLHLSVSAGTQALPTAAAEFGPEDLFGSGDAIVDPGPVARVEVGFGPAPVQVLLVTQLAVHDAVPWYDARELGTPFIGDFLLGGLGVGARFPRAFGRFRLVPRLEAGLAWFEAPVDQEVFRERISSEIVAGAAPRSAGLSVALGLEEGVVLFEDRVTAFVAQDLGFVTVTGVGLTVNLRVGLATTF